MDEAKKADPNANPLENKADDLLRIEVSDSKSPRP